MEWIFAVLGFLIFRIPGAIFGFVLGLILKNSSVRVHTENTRRIFQEPDYQQVTPADFELNLLSLCSLVIKANGHISQAELDFVRMRFVQMYGKERANAIFKTFNELVKGREISASRVASYLRIRTPYETRLQILHFLFGIAQADGSVSDSEVVQIQEIASYFGVSAADFQSIRAMFVNVKNSFEDAYTILEISPSATDAEVKKAYREMAKKYHPDKVITQDEAIKKGAEEKFKKVQQAYEQIAKQRNI